MKGPKIILTFSILFLLMRGFSAYSQGDDSGAMWVDEIRGTRISDSVASSPVAIPNGGVIGYVDTGLGHKFEIIRDGEGAGDQQVYSFDSGELALGAILPPGTYKVYPRRNAENDTGTEELTTIIHVLSVENDLGELE